jgi:hypothetical protein
LSLPQDAERDLADSLAEASDEDGRGGRRAVDYGDFIEAIKAEQDSGEQNERSRQFTTRDTDTLIEKFRRKMEDTLGSETNRYVLVSLAHCGDLQRRHPS